MRRGWLGAALAALALVGAPTAEAALASRAEIDAQVREALARLGADVGGGTAEEFGAQVRAAAAGGAPERPLLRGGTSLVARIRELLDSRGA